MLHLCRWLNAGKKPNEAWQCLPACQVYHLCGINLAISDSLNPVDKQGARYSSDCQHRCHKKSLSLLDLCWQSLAPFILHMPNCVREVLIAASLM